MGEVYKACDIRLDRTVAIKILPSELSGDASRWQRFEREAKVISSLNHPHICTLYDIGQKDSVDFIVMEFLEGESLAELLDKGPLPEAQVLQYGTQIASALDKAHRNGVTHRDLKPGNIMLTASGAKLLDFGLAKAEPAAATGATLTDMTPQATPMTQHGAVIGTVPYMSPEQVEGNEVDVRSDISLWARCCTKWLPGNGPFRARTNSAWPRLFCTLIPSQFELCDRSPRRRWSALSRFAWPRIPANAGSRRATSGRSCARSRRAPPKPDQIRLSASSQAPKRELRRSPACSRPHDGRAERPCAGSLFWPSRSSSLPQARSCS